MKQRKRRFTALIMALAMSVSLLPNFSAAYASEEQIGSDAFIMNENENGYAAAADIASQADMQIADLESSDGLTYTASDSEGKDIITSISAYIKEDGTAVIAKYNYIQGSSVESVKIPTYLKVKGNDTEYKVSEIADDAFSSSGLTSIKFAESGYELKKIGARAFSSNAITKIEGLPSSITELGDGCFMGNNKLDTVDLASLTQLKALSAECFRACSALTSVKLPENLTEIGASAFYDDKVLNGIKIPQSVNKIGTLAFRNTKQNMVINLSESHAGSIKGAPWGAIQGYVLWSKDYGYDNDSPYIIGTGEYGDEGIIYGLKTAITDNAGKPTYDPEYDYKTNQNDYKYYAYQAEQQSNPKATPTPEATPEPNGPNENESWMPEKVVSLYESDISPFTFGSTTPPPKSMSNGADISFNYKGQKYDFSKADDKQPKKFGTSHTLSFTAQYDGWVVLILDKDATGAASDKNLTINEDTRSLKDVPIDHNIGSKQAFEYPIKKDTKYEIKSSGEVVLYLAALYDNADETAPTPTTEVSAPTEAPETEPTYNDYISKTNGNYTDTDIGDNKNTSQFNVKITIPKSVKKTGAEGTAEDITITGIADGAFGSRPANTVISEIQFDSAANIPLIPEGAFWRSGPLTKVGEMPNTVKEIKKNAFRQCEKLTEITLPSELETIGYWAFRQCTELTKVTFDPGTYAEPSESDAPLVNIDSGAFSRCTMLRDIYMEGVTFEGENGKIKGIDDYEEGIKESAKTSHPFGSFLATVHYKNSNNVQPLAVHAVAIDEETVQESYSEYCPWWVNRKTGDVLFYVPEEYSATINKLTIPKKLTWYDDKDEQYKIINVTGVGHQDDNTDLLYWVYSGDGSTLTTARNTKEQIITISDVELHDKIERINDSVFYDIQIDNINLEDATSLEEIAYRAFGADSKKAIGNIVFPPNIKRIENQAFNNRIFSQGKKEDVKIGETTYNEVPVLELPKFIEFVDGGAFGGATGVGKMRIKQYQFNPTDEDYETVEDNYMRSPAEVSSLAPFNFSQYTPSDGDKKPFDVLVEYMDSNSPIYVDYDENSDVNDIRDGNTGRRVAGKPAGTPIPETKDCFGKEYTDSNDAVINLGIVMPLDVATVAKVEYVKPTTEAPGKPVNTEWWAPNASPEVVQRQGDDVADGNLTNPNNWHLTGSTLYEIKLSGIKGNGTATFKIIHSSLNDANKAIETYYNVPINIYHKQEYDANGGSNAPTAASGYKESGVAALAAAIDAGENSGNCYVETYGVPVTGQEKMTAPSDSSASLIGWYVVNKDKTLPEEYKNKVLTNQADVKKLKNDKENFIPIKDGMTDDSESSVKLAMGETDRTLYAIWADVGASAVEYQTGVGDSGDEGGVVNMPADEDGIEPDSKFIIQPARYNQTPPAREGYKFLGWKHKVGEEAVAWDTPEQAKDYTSEDGAYIEYNGTALYQPGYYFTKSNGTDIFQAVWEPEGYAVVYHGNGYTSGNVPADQPIEANADGGAAGKTFKAAANEGDNALKRDYAVFLGWAIEQKNLIKTTDEVPAGFDLIKAGTENVTFMPVSDTRVMDLYAVWAVDIYGYQTEGDTVTASGYDISDGIEDYLQVLYDKNSGQDAVENMPQDKKKHNAGDNVTVLPAGAEPELPERKGYTFKEWNSQADGSGNGYTPNTTFNKSNGVDILYAIWEPVEVPDEYGVIYHENHATGGSTPTESKKYKIEQEITVKGNIGTAEDSSDKLTKANAVFLGWSLKPLDDIKGNTANKPTDGAGNTLTYRPEDGGAVTIYKADSKITLQEDLVTDGGGFLHLHAVWAEDTDGQGTPDYDDAKLIYDLENGTYNGKKDSITKYHKINPPEGPVNAVIDKTIQPTKENAVFLGWSEDDQTEDLMSAPEDGVLISRETVEIAISGNNSKTVYAVYAADKNSDGIADYLEHKVTFWNGSDIDSVEGMPSPNPMKNIATGATVTLPAEPTRPGYIFDGWKATEGDVKKADGGNVFRPGESFTMPDNDVEFTAQWKDDDYVVIYHGNGHTGGSVPTDGDKKYKHTEDGYDQNVTIAATPEGFERSGAYLLGWSTEEKPLITKAEEKPSQIYTASTSVNFTPNPENGKSMNLYAVWAADENGNGKPDYEENKYTLTYDYNGGTIDEADKKEDKDHLAGTTVVLDRTIIPTHEPQGDADAVFVGWTKENNAKNKVYSAADTAPKLEYTATFGTKEDGTDVIVYAVWALDADKNGVPDYQDKKVKLIYNFDGGYLGTNDETGKAPITVYYDRPTDKDLTVILNTEFNPTRGNNEVFIGWSLNKPASGNREAAASLPDDLQFKVTFAHDNPKDITVYAVYAVDNDEEGQSGHGNPDYNTFNVTYEGGVAPGETPQPDNIPSGATSYEPGDTVTVQGSAAKPERTGFVFTGWKMSDNGGTYQPDETFIMPNNDVKLTAQWSDGTHMIIYNGNQHTEGTAPKDEKTYIDGQSFKILGADTLKKTGHVFAGWTADEAKAPIGSYDTPSYESAILKPDTDGTFKLSPHSDVMNLYAVWAVDKNNNGTADYLENKYVLKYNAGNGTISDADEESNNKVKMDDNGGKKYLSGDNVILKTQSMTAPAPNSGHNGEKVVFAGWTAADEAQNKIYGRNDTAPDEVNDVTFVNADITVYAIWAYSDNNDEIPDYKEGKVRLIYNANGGYYGEDKSNTGDIIVYYDKTNDDRKVTLNNSRVPKHEEIDGKNVIFVGWTTDEGSGSKNPINERPEAEYLKDSVPLTNQDVTVYAVYAVDEYKNGETGEGGNGVPDYNKWSVTYDLNYTPIPEGVKTPEDPHMKTAGGHEPGDAVDLQEAPARDGYIFIGWKDDKLSGGDGSVYMTGTDRNYTMPERNVKFTAQWIEDDGYIVRYNLNGGNGSFNDSDKYIKEETSEDKYYIIQDGEKNYNAVIPEGKPIREKAVFLGWSNQPHDIFGSAPADEIEIFTSSENAPEFKPDKDGRIMNLYALWAVDENKNGNADYNDKKINIIYKNGVLDSDAEESKTVTNMPSDASVLSGLSYNIPNITPSRNGYSFDGWNGSDGKTYIPGETIDKVESDIILTAKWSAAYTVVYDLNGGDGDAPQDEGKYVIDGNVTITSTTPERKDHVFLGWTVDSAQDPVTTQAKKDELNGKILSGGNKTKYKLSPNSGMSMIFYALWAVDENNNGTPDYEEQWHIIYYHNGGTFKDHNKDNENDTAEDDTVTVSNLTYPSSGAGSQQRAFLNGAVKPTHIQQGGYDVVFVGWTEDKSVENKVLEEHVDAINQPALVSYVTIPDYSEWETYKYGSNNGYYPVYAVWGIDKNNNGKADYLDDMVRLIYDLNGGNIDTSTEQIIEHYKTNSEDVVLNKAFKPKKDNAVFLGWSLNQTDGAVTSKEEETAAEITDKVTLEDKDVTVYAVYAKDETGGKDPTKPDDPDKSNGNPDYNTHKLTYTDGVKADETNTTVTGMPEPPEKIYETDSRLKLAAAPTRDGYDFVGWQDSAGSAIYKAEEVYIMPDRDVTLTAIWNEKGKYSILYHGNGSTGGAVPADNTKYVKIEGETGKYHKDNEHETIDLTLMQPGDLQRTGAMFLGWSVNEPIALITTQAAADAAKDRIKMAGSNIEYAPETNGVVMNLYAVWAEDLNGDKTADYTEGQHIKVTFEANDLTPENTKVQPNTMPASPETVLRSVDYNIPGREPVREGYTFLGWKLQTGATINDVGGTLYRYGGTEPIKSAVKADNMSGDITLVAQWSAAYIVRYYANNLTSGENMSIDDDNGGKNYEVGGNVTLKKIKETEFTRENAVFLGWTAHIAQDLVTSAEMKPSSLLTEGDITQFAADPNSSVMTFYAVWAVDENNNDTPDYEEQWHIIYNHNGGTFTTTSGSAEVTVSELTYLSSTAEKTVRAFLNGAVVPKRETSDISVAFAGWTEDKEYAEKTQTVPIAAALSGSDRKEVDGKLRNNVIIPQQSAWDNTEYEYTDSAGKHSGYYPVYAVWAEDNNNDGVPDYQEGNIRLIYNLDGGALDGVVADVVCYINKADIEEADGYYTILLDEVIKPSRGEKSNPQVFVGWIDKAPGDAQNDLTVTDGHRAPLSKTDRDKAKELILNTNEVKLAVDFAEITVYALYADDKVNNGDDPTAPIDPNNAPSPKPNGNPDYNRYDVSYDLGSLPAEVKETLETPIDIHTYHEPKDVVDLAAAPEVNGYTFTGWEDTNGDMSVYIPGAERKYTMPERDVLFTALWTPAGEYSVRYHLNGGKYNDTNIAPADDTTYVQDVNDSAKYYKKGTENGDQITEYEIIESDKTRLTRENATFLGWTVGEEYMLQTSRPTVDYYPQEGKVLNYTPDNGGVVMTLHALWAVDADHNNIPDYEDGRYSVNLNDGVDPDDPDQVDPGTMPDPGSVLPNEDYTIPEKEPTRPSYDFDGWKIPDDPDDTVYRHDDPNNNRVPADKIPETGVTLEAQWKLKEYSVVYDGNVADGGEVPVDNGVYTIENTVTVTEHGTLAKNGYVFIGWTPHTAADPVLDVNGVPAGMLEPDNAENNSILFALSPDSTVMKFYAVWAVDSNKNGIPDYKEKYDITFGDGVRPEDPDYNPDKSPVEGIPGKQEGVLPGDTVTLPGTPPERPGYTFDGWINPNDPDSEPLKPGDSFTMPDGDVTVEPQWTKNPDTTETPKPTATPRPATSSGGGGGGGYKPATYTLKYEENGGSEIADESYSRGAKVTLSKVPEREGYVFDGWYSDENFTKKVTSLTIEGNTVVYAKWTAAEPSETIDPNGGSSGTSSTNRPSTPDMLNSEDHFAYVVGYDDGMVRPYNNITRAETVTIFYRLLKPEIRSANKTETNKYVDVDAGAWYNLMVSTMTKTGIVKGRSDTEFVPEASITRAEFAAICARFDNTANVQPSGFTDVEDHWAKSEIERAATLGWVAGYGDGTFRPDQFITRAEAMTMINRVLGRIPEHVDDLLDDMHVWPDNTTDDWYYIAVQEATNGHYADKKQNTAYEVWTKVDQNVTWDK